MFRHKVPAIKVARDRLLDLPVEQARTGALVLGGLRRACELADTLDSCITEDIFDKFYVFGNAVRRRFIFSTNWQPFRMMTRATG